MTSSLSATSTTPEKPLSTCPAIDRSRSRPADFNAPHPTQTIAVRASMAFMVSLTTLAPLSQAGSQSPLINPVRLVNLAAHVGEHGQHVLVDFENPGELRRGDAVVHVRGVHHLDDLVGEGGDGLGR